MTNVPSMPHKRQLRDIAIDFVLRRLQSEELPAAVLEIVEECLDSPSLCKLGLSKDLETYELRDLFFAGLREKGVSLPTVHEAGFALAKSYAAAVIDGRITPCAGANLIADIYCVETAAFERLNVFFRLIADYDGDVELSDFDNRRTVDECRRFLKDE